jgi:hypothetical protein
VGPARSHKAPERMRQKELARGGPRGSVHQSAAPRVGEMVQRGMRSERKWAVQRGYGPTASFHSFFLFLFLFSVFYFVCKF